MRQRAEIKDPRSTGRKRGRKILEETGRPYLCECKGCQSDTCGATNGHSCSYTPVEQSRSDTLDVNHINKDIMDNDPANLEWLCRPCHRAKDRETEKGQAHTSVEYEHYDPGFVLEIIPDKSPTTGVNADDLVCGTCGTLIAVDPDFTCPQCSEYWREIE